MRIHDYFGAEIEVVTEPSEMRQGDIFIGPEGGVFLIEKHEDGGFTFVRYMKDERKSGRSDRDQRFSGSVHESMAKHPSNYNDKPLATVQSIRDRKSKGKADG